MPPKPITALLAESRALLAIAWPMVIAQLAQVGSGVVDTVMAGHYSATDMAAIAIGYNIWLPVQLFFIGIMLGATFVIAQNVGAGRLQQVRDSLPQALWLALGIGLVAAPLLYFVEPLLELLALERTTQDKSLAYLQAVAFGMPAAALFQALRCHTQGIGILRPFAIASVLGLLANIPLNYALMYGRWGFPELGARGCGLATAISMWLGPLLIGLYMTRAEKLRPLLPPLRLVAPDFTAIGEITRVGLPLGLTFFMEIAFFTVIALLIATLGTTAIAAHQIAFNVWDVVYMPLIGIGSAMATRVGHAIGADDRAGVNLSLSCGTSIAVLMGLLCMCLLLAAPESLARAYTDHSAIQAMAISLIRLAALFIALDAAQIAATFCLRAFRDTRFPFVVSAVAYWLVSLPLGYWSGILRADNALDGTVGFWRSMIAGIAVSSILVFLRLWLTLRRPLPEAQRASR